MKLGDLLNVLGRAGDLPREMRDREVFGVAHDSRNVVPGSIFVAVRGFHSDGHQFVSQAIERGAIAVVVEKTSEETGTAAVPRIIVGDSRIALALLADAFYGHPSGKLRLIGITGTNGKTTTTYLVKSIIEAAGGAAGLIGTIDYRVGDRVYAAPNTTPESLDLQRLLAEIEGQGAGFCVMEVSSHALALHRTEGCSFAVAAFTNLTQDHLDFHETMESYFRAKLLLFENLTSDAHAVVNADDSRAQDIISSTRAKVVTTGFSDTADVRPAGPIEHGIRGLGFDVRTPDGPVRVDSPLIGRHNVHNILTAIGIGVALGAGPRALSAGINAMRSVPGRMEKVDAGQPFGLIVDYAHTEDALERLLEAVREIVPKRIITVFGCGGDRDRSKRPKMGAAALRGSDIVIVTSDNPRTEDAQMIIRDIEMGMTAGRKVDSIEMAARLQLDKTPYLVVPDRRHAIATAVRMAEQGDVVVLAGKGHEDYQIIGSTKTRFDDREVAREELRSLGAGTGRRGYRMQDGK